MRKGKGMADHISPDAKSLIAILGDPAHTTTRLLSVWESIPLLLMLDSDWKPGPLVIVGFNDYMMWPLFPPGSLLRLDTTVKRIREGTWSEFERPIYLIEYNNRFYCCHAQRRRDTILLISHAESPAPPSIRIDYKNVRIRGLLTPVFRPLATRGNKAGRKTKQSVIA